MITDGLVDSGKLSAKPVRELFAVLGAKLPMTNQDKEGQLRVQLDHDGVDDLLRVWETDRKVFAAADAEPALDAGRCANVDTRVLPSVGELVSERQSVLLRVDNALALVGEARLILPA